MNKTIAVLTGARLDYCGDDSLAIDALEAAGCQAYIKPTVGGQWVCIFDHGDHVAFTEPYKTEAHAAAVALLFKLEENHETAQQ